MLQVWPDTEMKPIQERLRAAKDLLVYVSSLFTSLVDRDFFVQARNHLPDAGLREAFRTAWMVLLEL